MTAGGSIMPNGMEHHIRADELFSTTDRRGLREPVRRIDEEGRYLLNSAIADAPVHHRDGREAAAAVRAKLIGLRSVPPETYPYLVEMAVPLVEGRTRRSTTPSASTSSWRASKPSPAGG